MLVLLGYHQRKPLRSSEFHSAADAQMVASPVTIETTQGEMHSWIGELLNSWCFCRSGKNQTRKNINLPLIFLKAEQVSWCYFQGKGESCQPYWAGIAPCAPLPQLCDPMPLCPSPPIPCSEFFSLLLEPSRIKQQICSPYQEAAASSHKPICVSFH